MVDGQGVGIVALQGQAGHAAELCREGVAKHGNHTYGTEGDEREGNAIVARNDVEAFRLVLDDVVHLTDVARRFLDGHDVLEVAGQAKGGFGGHVHTGTSRYIVEHDRQVCSFGHGLVVLVDTFLRRLIIIRYNDQEGIDTGHVVVLHALYHGLGAIATHAQQDRNSSAYTVDNGAFHLLLLFLAQRRSFGGCTQHTQEVRSVLQLIIHQAKQCFVIHATVFFERGNQCNPHSL